MITVIGCDGGPLGPQAQAALAAAATVAGAPRHLDTVPLPHTCERIEIKRLDDALDAVTVPRPGDASVVVLASGDPGFFGIVRALRARGERPRVIPAVSSVALAFARLGLDWDDALVVSAHGRDPRPALAAALAHPKAAILTAPGTAATLAAELIAAGRAVYAAELLGTPQEKLTDLSAAPGTTPADPNVLITVAPSPETSAETGAETSAGARAETGAVTAAAAAGPPRWLAGHPGAPDRWALPEDAFEHRDSMITKAEVRALVLARLGPGPGRTIWDVGAGSGSVAVECARFGAWVIAVEADQAQCERIRANAAAHGVYLRVQPGRAPGVLAGLPPADAVFAGGGDGEVLRAAIEAASPRRVVVTLASVQRVGETTALLATLGYTCDGVQLQASRLASLPGGQSRLAAQNPVFVLWGDR